MNPDVWNEKVGPHDWRWELAEQTCQDIAATGKDLDDPNRPQRWDYCKHMMVPCAPFKPLASFTYIAGRGAAPPWVVNPRTDRVIAYHGFDGTWVGWDRGGPVIPLKINEVVRFLRGEE